MLSRVADVAQQVERILGKDEVTGSNPVISLIPDHQYGGLGFFLFWMKSIVQLWRIHTAKGGKRNGIAKERGYLSLVR